MKPEIAFLDYELVRHLGYDENNPSTLTSATATSRCPNEDYEG